MGWQIVNAAIEDHRAAAAEADADIVTISSQAAMLDQFAMAQVKRPDGTPALGAARAAAEQALHLEPLDTRALALLAMIAERQGDRTTADELMRMAGRRTWHDPLVESWLLVRNLQKQDFTAALKPMDALLRTHSEMQPVPVGMLVQLVAEPSALNAVVGMLATSPPWRLGLLRELCAHLASTDELIALYRRLDQTGSRVTVEELRPYLDRLIAGHLYSDAYEDWVLMGPAKRLADLQQQPYNGDFSISPAGLPFDWILASVPGARMDIVRAPGAAGRGLRLQFSGARIAFDNVSQLLLLAPGDYHFSGSSMANNLQTSRGLQWRVTCAQTPNAALGETDLIAGTKPWSRFDTDFHVPSKGCEAQWLRLELPARTATEHDIEGEVWYRDLRITPRPAPSAASAQGAGGL